MTQASRTIDVQSFIDTARFSSCQWLVLALCFLVVAADGYDTAAIGFIAPSLAHEWGIARSELGVVMSAALAGLSLGAIFAGPVADRIGRKTVLVAAVTCFGAWTLVAAHAQTIMALTVLRFLTGLGLGAAMPTTITMMSEYAPARLRSLTVNAMYCGFSAGLVAGGAASAWLIPHFGWPSVLTAGGIAPLGLAVLLLALLPESAQFLAVRAGAGERIAAILKRIDPRQSLEHCTFVAPVAVAGKHGKASALALILSAGYRRRTFLLWLACFMSLVIYYLMTNWMPTLFREAGFSVERGALLASLFSLGGLLGNLAAGWMMDRFNANRTIVVAYMLAAALVVMVGRSIDHPQFLGLSLFLCGTVVTSAATSMSTYAASLYPTEARTTGVAWMQGIGRIGGMAGAFIGAGLLGLGWGFADVFGLLAVPAMVAACAVFVIAKPCQGYPVARAAE
ncbi:MFS transporter [Cupriavidus numazuensis]|uniref:4-hydroxybenzoate transporter PcaK n=1 Tax=Cupriavidus numazuensis TaxID=221992 RepID=A0ABN7Q9M9_9BURK|nr:MFS transporter [Cupriavidus numazuensis]CAG2160104.1 4-hydroxybenzoate transporter PcaK [Cupriavidus numazuensis]